MDEDDDKINVPVACNKSMRLLARGCDSRTVSAKTGMSGRAVDLVADAMSRKGATSERGWESLPDAVRFSLIKSEYYPVPPRDAWIMARLLAEGATCPDSAVRMPEDGCMRELVRSKLVGRAGRRFYLANAGPSLAREVLSMYPEIGSPAFSRSGGAGRRARRLVELVAWTAPPRLAAASGMVPAR